MNKVSKESVKIFIKLIKHIGENHVNNLYME